MIDVGSHHSSKSSEDEEEEEEDQTDEETEAEVSEEDNIESASSSGEEEEEHREAADELKHLKSHPSLTPTPPTDEDQPTSSAETVLDRFKSSKVASNNPQEADLTESRRELLERIVDSCLEEEGGEIEESGPALVIVKSIDEADEDCSEYLRQTSVPDENQESLEELGYNPDAEYLSDPDFHDERPGKNTSDSNSHQVEESRESEKLRERFQRQTKVTEEDSDTIDESESAISVEQEIVSASDTDRPLEAAGDDDNSTSDSDPVGSDLNEKQDEKEAVEEEEEEDTTDEEEKSEHEFEGESEHSRTTFTIKLPASSSENEIQEEIEDSTSQEQVVEEFVVKLGGSGCEIEPVLKNEDRAENELIENLQTAEGGSTGANSIKPNRIENQVSEDQTEDSSENQQVTASEAQAELFIDESTLAEDIASLQSSIALIRLSETVSTTGEAEGVQEYDRDEDITCADDIAIEETAPVLCSIERVRNLELKASNSRQESLDDVESEVLDINYIAEPVETQMRNEVQMSQQNTGDIGSGALSSDTMLLTEQVSGYCDTLVDSITNEAVLKVGLIAARATSLVEQSLFKALECTSSASAHTTGSKHLRIYNYEEDDSGEAEDCLATTSQRKIYTSSMYYDDKQNSFPTIERQLEYSRQIAKQLEIGLSSVEQSPSCDDQQQQQQRIVGDSSSQLACDGSSSGSDRRSRVRRQQSERASFMFGRRRERADQFTVESSIEDSSSLVDGSQCSLPPRCHQQRHPSARLQRRRASLEPSSLTCYNATILDRDAVPRRARERRRLSQWDLLSVSDNDLTALTDTEYEAPRVRRRAQPTRATTTPFRERTSRHVEVDTGDRSTTAWDQSAGKKGQEVNAKRPTSSLKPFLDSSTLKDIERLRHWTPFEEFNEHNSVSPEICLKLVQDLKSCGTVRSEQAVSTNLTDEFHADVSRTNSAPVKCRGAQLFERRQLQSSDWIVEDKSRQADKQVAAEEPTSGADGVIVPDSSTKVDQDLIAEAATEIKQQIHHARPSFSEETLVVTDESNLSQLVELVPAVVMSYSQPQLEVATVTRTPSFSASSWRVIECDSPDLLTLRDDEEEEERNLSQSETIGNDDGDGDDDDLMEDADNAAEHQLGSGLLGEKLQGGAVFSQQEDQNSSCFEELTETRMAFTDHEATLTPEIQVAEATLGRVDQMSSVLERNFQEPLEDAEAPLKPITVMTRVKPQTRAGELYQASLVEWRPHVMTPTRMVCSPSTAARSTFDRDEAVRSVASSIRTPLAPMKRHQTGSPINHRRRCSSLTHEQGFSMKTHSNLQQRRAQFTESPQPDCRSSVSSMRGNYQNLIGDVHCKSSTHTKYRSYHYPFANRDRLRAFETHQRSRSLLRDDIKPFSAPTSPPLPPRTDSMRADIQQYLADLRARESISMIRDSSQHPTSSAKGYLLSPDDHSELSDRAEPSYSQPRQVCPVNSPRSSTGLSAGTYDTYRVAEHPPRLSSVMGCQQLSRATTSGLLQTFPVRREQPTSSLNLAEQSGVRSNMSSACSHHQQEISQNISEQCVLRVCIKLPHKLHKIIICRIPNVTFATLMHQQ